MAPDSWLRHAFYGVICSGACGEFIHRSSRVSSSPAKRSHARASLRLLSQLLTPPARTPLQAHLPALRLLPELRGLLLSLVPLTNLELRVRRSTSSPTLSAHKSCADFSKTPARTSSSECLFRRCARSPENSRIYRWQTSAGSCNPLFTKSGRWPTRSSAANFEKLRKPTKRRSSISTCATAGTFATGTQSTAARPTSSARGSSNATKLFYMSLPNPCVSGDRRIAIVSTWWFIRKGHVEDTFALAEILLYDPEDLIQKATGLDVARRRQERSSRP